MKKVQDMSLDEMGAVALEIASRVKAMLKEPLPALKRMSMEQAQEMMTDGGNLLRDAFSRMN